MSHEGNTFLRGLKCANCYEDLTDPVQLSQCLHIVCIKCKDNLRDDIGNFFCPLCKDKTLKLESSGCDYSPHHDSAKYNCFDCYKLMCSICSIEHTTNHNIYQLQQTAAREDTLLNEASPSVAFQDVEVNDSASPDEIQCPMCNKATCKHIQSLQNLMAGHQSYNNRCQIHVDSSQNPRELKMFCKVCWTPICRDCSAEVHKPHETVNISNCEQFTIKSLEVSLEKLKLLIRTTQLDASKEKDIQDQLQQHVIDTVKDLNNRKKNIIDQTENVFEEAIADAVSQGRSILANYTEKLNKIAKCIAFLQEIKDALFNIDTEIQDSAPAQYSKTFFIQEKVNELIQDFHDKYCTFPQIEEKQFILPEMKAIISPSHYLAQVRTERKQLELAFSFVLKGDYLWANSIIVKDNDKCLLSVRMSREVTDFDCIVLCQHKGNDTAEFKEYDVQQGKYLLSQLQSGEIVASFSCYKKFPKTCSNKVLYFDGTLDRGTKLSFDVITEFHFPPYGIAATKDNNIILCVRADEQLPAGKMSAENMSLEEKGLCHVITMSLRGKLLKSSLTQPGANLIEPNYIAVSDSGEVCISDTKNSNIVILDENLTIKERVNYQLPTSLTHVELKFRPHGVCYDSYGRIIVADPDNNSVIRLVRSPHSHNYILEPLLSESSVPAFTKPNLVTLDRDSRLWVVCSMKVFVFHYGDDFIPVNLLGTKIL